MKTLWIILLCFICPIVGFSQSFSQYFADKTLRLDYIFSGDCKSQYIALDAMSSMPRWYGKRQRLSECPMEGYGQIIVKAKDDSTIIYRNSFSTLFQEWQTYPEAEHTSRSFENVFLVPLPLDTANITIELRDNRRKVTASFTHKFFPNDILIQQKGNTPTPYVTLQEASDTTRCIHIAYVAEGYTESEMNLFLADAREATEALFAHEPFKSNRNRFNIIAVKSVSAESGPSIPHKNIWHQTVLGSHFDTFYSERYLTTLHLKTLHDVLAGTPYEHIIVLVNSDEYGGGGILNSYNLTSCHHKWFKPVVVHEFGHSFAGLADEYAYDFEAIPMYPHDVEPWEKNITTLVNFEEKWKDMLPKDVPIPTPIGEQQHNLANKLGVYEGAGYSMKGVYRPVPDCRMRTNTYPDFCPVCNQALQSVIDFYTK